MRRLAQPGWFLLQGGIVALWFWIFYMTPSETEPTNWFAPLIIGLVCAWSATVVILITKQLVTDTRRWLSGARSRATAADRLARPHSSEQVEQRKQASRLPLGR
jgi:hypothetical protein